MARTKKDWPALTGPVPHQGTTPHTQEDTMTGTQTQIPTITGRRLYDMLTMVLPHAEPLEEALDGAGLVCIEVRDTSLYVVATDRYTLGVARHVLDAPAPRVRITMPRDGAHELLAALERHLGDTITIAVGDGEAVVRVGHRRLAVYPTNRHFPAWRGMVHDLLLQPREASGGYTVIKPHLVARLRAACELTGAPAEVLSVAPDRAHLVRVGGGYLAVLASTQIGPEWGGGRVLDLAADLAQVEALPAPADPGDELDQARRRIRELEAAIDRMEDEGVLHPDVL